MKIICIGRNYVDHAKELNNPLPSEPVVFFKPDSSILPKRNPLYIPDFTKDLHYEIELVVRINRLGKNIEEKFAHKYFDEIGIGIDFTARDVQKRLKEKGLPWEKAKAFDGSAAIGDKFLNVKDLPDNLSFYLNKNGETVQMGNSKDMIFSIPKLIAFVSTFFSLKIGDLIFTGTPAGVGQVQIGDRLECYLEEEKLLKVDIR